MWADGLTGQAVGLPSSSSHGTLTPLLCLHSHSLQLEAHRVQLQLVTPVAMRLPGCGSFLQLHGNGCKSTRQLPVKTADYKGILGT